MDPIDRITIDIPVMYDFYWPWNDIPKSWSSYIFLRMVEFIVEGTLCAQAQLDHDFLTFLLR